MLISSRGKHGLSIMIDIATHGSEATPAKASEVCRRLGIALKYAEQIINQLTSKHLLKSKRGSSGGYYLSMPAKTYTVNAIVSACERLPILAVSNAKRLKKMAQPEAVFWAEFNAAVHTFMANKTLDTFITETTKKGKRNIRRKAAG